ncbi:MAG: dipeptidase [Bacteroidetes bacterium]|nr:dipeptidase [Bacteroidota bacterium]
MEFRFSDAHNDLLQRAIAGDDIASRLPDGHSDFIRMQEAGIAVQILSVWVPVRYAEQNLSWNQAQNLISAFYTAAEKAGSLVRTVRSAREIRENLAGNRLSLLMGMEGGHPIENSLEKLEQLGRQGIRYLSPTWNNSTTWASSARDEQSPVWQGRKGLSDFGREVIRKMNETGIIPDVSHVGEQTFQDMISESRKPVIASHSAVWELCRHPRNLKDNQMKAIADTGGVVFINFFSGFIDPDYFPERNRILSAVKSAEFFPDESQFRNYEDYFTHEDRQIGQWVAGARPEFDRLIDHILYAVRLIGADHVGLGSDFDGIETAPAGLDSVLDLKKIPGALHRRGLSDSEIEKICLTNLIRVLEDTEQP